MTSESILLRCISNFLLSFSEGEQHEKNRVKMSQRSRIDSKMFVLSRRLPPSSDRRRFPRTLSRDPQTRLGSFFHGLAVLGFP